MAEAVTHVPSSCGARRNTYRILAQDAQICNDTWHTGLNNNDLIIGSSGAGKTRSYVKPNLIVVRQIVVEESGTIKK